MPDPRVRAMVRLRVLVEDEEDGDPTPHPLLVRPISVDIESNSVREADRATIELDYRDFPFDPRAIRFAQATVHMGDVGLSDRPLPADETTLRFLGIVDKCDTSHGEDGSTVRLECRDYTAYLLDAVWTGGAIDIDRPLRHVVAEVLSRVPSVARLAYRFSPRVSEIHLSRMLGKTIYTPEGEVDAWTVLSDLCGLAGLIPVMAGDTLYVVTTDDLGMRYVEHPDGRVERIPPLHARLTLGYDIERLTYARNYNETARHQIQINCWDPERRESRTVLYPADGIVLSRKIDAKGKTTTEKAAILPFFQTGSYSDDVLREMARRIYDERAREQLEGSFETGRARDIEGVDLLGLANGHRVTLKMEPDDVMVLETMSRSEGVRYLVGRGYNEAVAEALMQAKARANRISVVFYVRRARHKWGADDGYSLEVEFINLVGTRGQGG